MVSDCRETSSSSLFSLRTGLAAVFAFALVISACETADEAVTDPDEDEDPVEAAVDLDDDRRVPTLRYLGPGSAWTPSVDEASRLFETTIREIGVEVELSTVPDFATFSSEVQNFDEWDFALAGVIARPERVDPEPLFSPYFHADGAFNFSAYENSEISELIDAQRSEMDVERRQELVHEVQALLADDLPMVTWFHPHTGHVYNYSRFGDVVLSITEGYWHIFNLTSARPLAGDDVMGVGLMAPLPTLNPLAFDDFGLHVDAARWIFDSLARLGPETADGEPEPWMAESWEIRDDLNVRVDLRDDLLFHDGTPVTAEDVKFSYEYIAEWEPGVMVDAVSLIDSVDVIDSHTVEFVLSEAYAPIFITSFTVVPILPQHLWEGQVEELGLSHPREWEDAPLVGSGPFQFGHLRPREELLLGAFPDHFAPPHVDELLIRVFSDPEGMFRALQGEEIHFTETALRLTPRHIERIEQEFADFLEVSWAPTITTRWMHFNMREGHPTADLAFRQAIAHVIDYESMVFDVLEERGDVGAGPIAPVNEFWHADDVNWPRFDPERARQILEDAGYEWDTEGRLYYPAEDN